MHRAHASPSDHNTVSEKMSQLTVSMHYNFVSLVEYLYCFHLLTVLEVRDSKALLPTIHRYYRNARFSYPSDTDPFLADDILRPFRHPQIQGPNCKHYG